MSMDFLSDQLESLDLGVLVGVGRKRKRGTTRVCERELQPGRPHEIVVSTALTTTGITSKSLHATLLARRRSKSPRPRASSPSSRAERRRSPKPKRKRSGPTPRSTALRGIIRGSRPSVSKLMCWRAGRRRRHPSQSGPCATRSAP